MTDDEAPLKSIGAAFKFFASLPEALSFDFRKDALNETVGEVLVDSVRAIDTEKWETGVRVAKGQWVIVEQYETKEEAYAGHAKWVEQVKAGKRDFKDIDLWGLNDW